MWYPADLGQVIGIGPNGAYRQTGKVTTNLGSLGGTSGPTQPNGINWLGEVVGYSYLPDGDFRGFIWANGTMTALGTLGGDWSQAYAVNTSGQVTGTAYKAGNLSNPAFLFSNGTMKNLGTLNGGTTAVGTSINTSGVIVGYGNVPNPNTMVYHAFIYTGSKMQDLNNMIPSNSGWVLSQANGINDLGQIVGFGTIKGQVHGFLLNAQ